MQLNSMNTPDNTSFDKMAALSGARPGAIASTFTDPSIKGHPVCLALVDKNPGGGPKTRLVATILEAYYESTSMRIEGSLGMTPRNSPRKAMLTGLSESGVAQLSLSTFSEHADNALSMGGPLCPIPSSAILRDSQSALKKFLKGRDIPMGTVIKSGCLDKANLELKRFRHTSGVFLPSADDFALVEQVIDHIRSLNVGRSRLLMALLLELTASGIIPFGNLAQYCAYYTLRDFCLADEDLFFMALLPQKGGGMGTIPIRVKSDEVSQLIKDAFSDYRLRALKLVPEMLSAIGQILPSIGVTRIQFLYSLKRVSYYRCQYHFSGFVAAALTGRLQIPANYISEKDLFATMEHKQVIGLHGKAWFSPHATSDRWQEKHDRLSFDSLTGISQGQYFVRTGSRGPTVSLPVSLHSSPAKWTTTEWCAFARLFGPTPRTKTVKQWIAQAANEPVRSKRNQLLAQDIMSLLRKTGAIKLDRPARIIPPRQFDSFMTALLTDLKNEFPGKRGKRLAAGVMLAAVIGARPKELYRLRGNDVRLRGQLLWVRIKGVKKTMRSQRDAIGNLLLTGVRQKLLDTQRTELRELPPSELERVCDYDSFSSRQFRDAVNAAIQRVAKSLFGESEGFRFYTLRRECSILALDGLLKVANSANYFDLLGTIARNGGHSLPEFLGGYIGTSILVL